GTRPHRAHRRRHALPPRRDLPIRDQGPWVCPERVLAPLAPLRPFEAARQGPHRQAPSLSALSTSPARILDLLGLPQTLRADLRSACRWHPPSDQRRRPPTPRQPISTRPAL